MTPSDVLARIEAIKAQRGDDEAQHSMEDALYADVLLAIAAKECESPDLVALAALTTRHLHFSRWYA